MEQWFIGNTEIVKAEVGGSVVWEKPDKTIPFYVENITDSTETLIVKKFNSSAPSVTIEISSDKINWSTFGTTSTTGITRTILPGERLYMRANTGAWGVKITSGSTTEFSHNMIQGVSKVGGNVMSLIYGENFTGNETSFPANTSVNLMGLFYENTTLTHAGELILPATTLTEYCYCAMFVTSSVRYTPVLPASTLVEGCYEQMFQYCPDIQKVICLATNISAYNCTLNWLNGNVYYRTFIKKTNTVWPQGASGIPASWTVIEA